MGSFTLQKLGCTIMCGVCIALVGCTDSRMREFEPTEEPVIAVLCQMSQEIVLLDPADMRELQRIPLRSQALDMDVTGRSILTAQCGGHGSDMGREFGRIALATGRVDYTELDSMDIQMVSAPTGGWFMLTTGLISAEGQWLHRVSDGEVENLQLGPGVCGCVATGKNVWVWHYWDDETGHPEDRYLIYESRGEPQTISSELTMTVALLGFEQQVVAFGVEGDAAKLVRYDARDGTVLSTGRVDGFEDGPSYAWAAGEHIAIADGPAGDYYAASRLVLVDSATLEPEGVLEPVRGVSAVNAAPDGKLIICEGDGTVSLLDPATLEVCESAVVGDPRGDLVDVEYVP